MNERLRTNRSGKRRSTEDDEFDEIELQNAVQDAQNENQKTKVK